MSDSVLIGYATRYGSTGEVAEAIAKTLRESGLLVDVRLLREVKTLTNYRAFVLGAPLYMFQWHKDIRRFLSRYLDSLIERPVTIFALGPVHDPYDEEEWQASWIQLKKELAKFPRLKPIALEMFGGKYDPENLSFPLKMFAGGEPASDIRDWKAVRNWVDSLSTKLS